MGFLVRSLWAWVPPQALGECVPWVVFSGEVPVGAVPLKAWSNYGGFESWAWSLDKRKVSVHVFIHPAAAVLSRVLASCDFTKQA